MTSLKKDFFFKLTTNAIRIPISIFLQAFFPRLLGVENYGKFDFLTDFSNKIISFFDSGISVFFYTQLSQKSDNLKLIKFFSKAILFISILYIGFVIFCILFNLQNNLWPGHEISFIIWSSILGIITFISNLIIRIIDASNLTVRGEKIKILHLVISVLTFFLIYLFLSKTGLGKFYLIQFFLVVLLVSFNLILLGTSTNYLKFSKIKLSRLEYKNFTKQLWDYSHPLLFSGFITLIAILGERWILQVYSGDVQQGYFALSNKVSSFIFLFSGALMPLLMREFARYFGSNDIERISTLFDKTFRLIYFLVCFISIFIAINSKLITELLGGDEFTQANLVVSLMSFYPIHQTLGQLNGTTFLSTNRTKQYRNLALVINPISLILCYILIVPGVLFEKGLGAVGLVIEMLVSQIIIQNIMLLANCKYLKINFSSLFFFQWIVITILFAICSLLYQFLLTLQINNILAFIINFFLYTTISCLIIFLYPKLLSISSRNELYNLFTLKNKE